MEQTLSGNLSNEVCAAQTAVAVRVAAVTRRLRKAA
jgi:hypothetical protein